jgi:hypothetical protein
MEEALTSSSLPEEHRALMGAVLQSLRSVDNRLKEACSGLLAGFKVSHVMTFSFRDFLLFEQATLYTVAPEPCVSLKSSCGGRITLRYRRLQNKQ